MESSISSYIEQRSTLSSNSPLKERKPFRIRIYIGLLAKSNHSLLPYSIASSLPEGRNESREEG